MRRYNSTDTATRNFRIDFDVAYTLADPTPGGGPGPQTTHFTGTLAGSVGAGATSLAFNVADFGPALGSGPTVTAGDGTFQITLDSFKNPAGLGAGPDALGGLTARVTAGGAPAAVPEPSSLALLGLGACGLLACARRRHQARAG